MYEEKVRKTGVGGGMWSVWFKVAKSDDGPGSANFCNIGGDLLKLWSMGWPLDRQGLADK
jgi:hypothetical protein